MPDTPSEGALIEDLSRGAPVYSLERFEQDLARMRPRAFDIYFLGPFMIYFAVRSKAGMGRWTRRILFTAGVYTIYRNWQAYKSIPATAAEYASLIPAVAQQ